MKTVKIPYYDDDLELEGHLVYDDSQGGKRPAVLICHAIRGQDEFVLSKAEEMGKEGYVGFALDMYGKGLTFETIEDAGEIHDEFEKDRMKLRHRVNLGLSALSSQDVVDSDRIGAIGYCFGGMCALELARSGAAVRGVVSFHGLLDTRRMEDAQNIQCKVLALHGYEDPLTRDQVEGFQQEMNQAAVDWQLHVYGGACHSFTNPAANQPERGLRYDPSANRRSWRAMMNFFQEIFG